MPVFMLAASTSVFELVCLMWLYSFALLDIFRFVCRTDYEAYHAISRFSLKTIETLATFSAMKMLRIVHPSLLYDHVTGAMSDPFCGQSKTAKAMQAVYFFCYCALFATFGVIAFMMKIIEVASVFSEPPYERVRPLLYTFCFLNQVMGIVVLDHVLQQRVFVIMFGGEDGELNHDERVFLKVYQARVCRAIWKTYWEQGKGLDPWKALMVLLTFDHVDLQRLIIREDYQEKTSVEGDLFEDRWKERASASLIKAAGDSSTIIPPSSAREAADTQHRTLTPRTIQVGTANVGIRFAQIPQLPVGGISMPNLQQLHAQQSLGRVSPQGTPRILSPCQSFPPVSCFPATNTCVPMFSSAWGPRPGASPVTTTRTHSPGVQHSSPVTTTRTPSPGVQHRHSTSFAHAAHTPSTPAPMGWIVR